VVFDLHAFDARKYPGDIVVIDDLEHKLNVGEHDVSGASRDQIEALSLFLSCLDFALGELAPELVRFDDKAAAMNARKFGESDLICSPPTHEYLVAFVSIGSPGAGEFRGGGAFGQQEGQHHGGPQNLSNTRHIRSLLHPFETNASVTAQHQRLDRQQQRLDSQQHGVDQANSIDRMQHKALQRAGIL
jgi:hypothetical protein